MPFDRDGALKKAEKLLRQGKLDLAIVEYRSVIEADSTDWNTANTLGDLYFRAGQVEKAVGEYGRIADHLASEGFTPKAVALYRKILKIKPDEERAMWHLGQIAARQGLLVDARASFMTLLERRRLRGDRRGEAEVRLRLGDLDGADLDTRLMGARARIELDQPEQAVEKLKQIAGDLQDKGRADEALQVLSEAAGFAPDDTELRRSLMHAYAAKGDLDAARQYTSSSDELKEIAEELFRLGREDEGLSVLASAAEADPTDTAVRARLARALITRGDMAGARQMLTEEVAGTDPELLWTLAEMELRDGRIPEGTTLLKRLLDNDPGKRDALVILGCSVAEVNPDAGYECIEVAARIAIAADEWGEAAAALNEFVNRVPNHIPALMHLVEICVDGGLEATMHSAQVQLADAYLEVGAGVEARVIAEDLVAREPWERANIERFRRALTLLGETDIDAVIADRLSGQSPFVSTDFLWPSEPAVESMPEATPEPEPEREPEPVGDAAPPPVMSSYQAEHDAPGQQEEIHADIIPPQVAAVAEPPARKPGASFHAIDLSAFLEDEPEPPQQTHDERRAARPETQEIDLSAALSGFQADEDAPAPGPAKPTVSLESVLKGVRDEAVHDAGASPEVAEQHFKLATAYLEMGQPEEAMKALEVSARSPRHRFRAGALLAKLLMDRGAQEKAIEWFERAAEAPAPSPAAAHQLLYELAGALEAQGESARALAVLLELQSEAGEYRDLAARLEHLMGS